MYLGRILRIMNALNMIFRQQLAVFSSHIDTSGTEEAGASDILYIYIILPIAVENRFISFESEGAREPEKL